MRIDLHRLAGTLAKMDNPSGRNVDIVAAAVVLAALGRYLASLPEFERAEVVTAIVERGGQRACGILLS